VRSISDSSASDGISDDAPTVLVASTATSAAAIVDPPPDRIGRYRVLARIGHGGMGEVLRAFDPELDRNVAIKLVRGRAAADGPEQQVLVAEARALARLSHPNIVQVYDVGTHAGQVFLAMELVEGQTLHRWLSGTPQPEWREVLAAFIDAGRGLAAAHAAALVHGDFKPGNVMVAADGRARVFDFGLARQVLHTAASAGVPAGSDENVEVVRGTPTFMAPEQMLGQSLTAASDQFSFCVALHLGLFRSPPFEGDTLDSRRRNVASGAFRPAQLRGVPPALRRLILRGLASAPEDRHPSMDALLAALQRVLGRRRRWIVGGGLAAGATAVVVAIAMSSDRAAAGSCEHGALRSGAVWSADRRDAVAAAFAAQDKAYATEGAVRVTAILDAYVAAWNEGHRAACEAAKDDDRKLDAQMACLADGLVDLDASVRVLETADEIVVKRGAAIAADLPSPMLCLEGAVDETAPRDEWTTRIRERTAAGRASSRAGHYRDAIAILEDVLAEPGMDARPDLRSAAALLLAEAYELNGERTKSLPLFREAIALTAEVKDPIAEARGWIHIARIASAEAQFDEATSALKQGELLLARLRNDGTVPASTLADLEADLGINAGVVEIGRADYAAAIARLEAGLAAAKGGAAAERLAGLLNNLGVAHGMQGQHTLAREYFGRAAEAKLALYGPGHPDVATCRVNEAVSYHHSGDPERAVELFRDVITIREAALGPMHPELATAYNGIATSYNALGRFDEALPIYRKALAIREKALGVDHPATALLRNNIADLLLKQGHPEEATAYVEEALAHLQRKLGDEHPHTAYALHTLGEVRLARGQPAAAMEPLERVMKLREKSPGDGRDLAVTQFAYARALGESNVDLARARTIAIQARARLVELDRDPEIVREIDTWIAAHPISN
jgi:tetratricopeptide (TPR) repeat protein